MWFKGLTLEVEIVRNPNVSLSPTLARNEKVEHYIRIKTHKSIVLRYRLRVVSMPYVVELRTYWCCISPVKPLYNPNTS